VLVERDSALYDKVVKFFERVRELTDLRKGLLRLPI